VSVLRILVALLIAFAVGFAPGVSSAKPKTRLDVTEVVLLPKRERHEAEEKRVGREVRRAAQRAAKALDFGGHRRVEVRLEVTELEVVQQGDVLRVSCTIVGKLRGGGSARSRLSFGGSPERRSALERQVIGMVTEGVVTRLAELARQRSERPPGST
jgi:hypothetical protein